MTVADVMARLEALGDARVRRLNSRVGAGEGSFGVKLGDLRTLAKEIKINPPLAAELWETGHGDAMLLATLLMRPKALPAEDLDRMVRVATYAQLADWLGSYVVKAHPQKEALRRQWMEDHDPMALRAGWSLTAERVARAPDGLDLSALLDRIEREMGKAPAAVSPVGCVVGTIERSFPPRTTCGRGT